MPLETPCCMYVMCRYMHITCRGKTSVGKIMLMFMCKEGLSLLRPPLLTASSVIVRARYLVVSIVHRVSLNHHVLLQCQACIKSSELHAPEIFTSSTRIRCYSEVLEGPIVRFPRRRISCAPLCTKTRLSPSKYPGTTLEYPAVVSRIRNPCAQVR